jgi:hypothetical protein
MALMISSPLAKAGVFLPGVRRVTGIAKPGRDGLGLLWIEAQ